MASPNNILKSTGKLFNTVEYIKDEGGATVTELADHFDIPKSTVQVYLNTLYCHGFVEQRGGRYELGWKFLEVGMATLRNQPEFPIIKPKVNQLAETTGELASWFVEERGEAVYIYGVEGHQSISTDLSMGERTDLHCTASGKAILAHLPEERIEEIVSTRGLRPVTENSITDSEKLWEEVEHIRDKGFALADQESIKGVRVIAAPVLYDDEVVGAIGLAGPANRFVGERLESDIPEIVMGTANEIELNLQYSDSGI